MSGWGRARRAWFWVGRQTGWWPQRVLGAVVYVAWMWRLSREGRRRR